MAKVTPAAHATRSPNPAEAAIVIAAAASLATAAVAAAASTAITTLTDAASVAAKVVSDASTKAISEFPRLQEDIREIRAAQSNEGANLTKVVSALLDAHTHAEELRLGSIEATLKKIDAYMTTQDGRLMVVEKQITRHQLILFGIAGPVCLLVIGTVLTILAKNFTTTLGAWLQ